MQENVSLQEQSKKFVELKQRRNCLVLAHNYVDLAIQKVADYVGDSLQMAQFAASKEADLILVCSIRIMGESVSLLNPDKKVIMAHPDADCELANMQSLDSLDDLLAAHPDAEVVCYVNSPMPLRARSTITCTSANCLKVIESLPKDKEIIFIPDSNIGRYAQWKTGRELILTDSYCYVHQQISLEEAKQVKAEHPDYTLLVHPECRLEVCQFADIVCSTSQMIAYTQNHDKLILGTETGLYDQLRQRFPQKEIIPLSAVMVCRDMKKLTLVDAYQALTVESYPVEINSKVREKALKSLNRMLALDV
jgi:quinolinate synthase